MTWGGGGGVVHLGTSNTSIVSIIAVHLMDQAAELRTGVVRVRSEGELCEMFPRRMIASDIQ